MPWICGSMMVTEEEVNPILALFHHVANEIATHINLGAGGSRSELATSKCLANFCYVLRNYLHQTMFVEELLQRTGQCTVGEW